MGKSEQQIVASFLLRCVKRVRYRKKIRMDEEARKIQTCFRRYLMRREFHRFYLNQAALRIQRRYRRFRRDMKENEQRRVAFSLTRDRMVLEHAVRDGKGKKKEGQETKKVIVELRQPWTASEGKRLSPTQMDERLADQLKDVQWVTQYVMPTFWRKVVNDIEQREKLRLRNEMFETRKVSRKFFSMVYRTLEPLGRRITGLFLHESTFRVFFVHENGVTIQSVDSEQDVFAFYESPGAIMDSAFDKRCARVLCLLKNWKMTVFENGFFSSPRTLHIPKPILPQDKYLFCDKMGHVWVVLTKGHGVAFMLEPLCFSVLEKIQFEFPKKSGEIRHVVPIVQNEVVTGFFCSSSGCGDVFLSGNDGSTQETFSNHRQFTPRLLMTQGHLFTYGRDKKVVVYRRRRQNLRFLKAIECRAVPTSIAYIKGFAILVVACSDFALRFYTLGNEVFHISLPPENISDDLAPYAESVLGPPKTTRAFSQGSLVLTFRLPHKPVFVSTAQYAFNCGFVAVALDDGQVATFWLNRRANKVSCATYDTINFAPTVISQTLAAREKGQMEFEVIFPSVIQTRQQLERDSKFLRQAPHVIEMRFIASMFMKRSSEECAHIILQSPYRRWCRFLKFAGNNVSLYEFFLLISRVNILVPSLGSPSAFNTFLVDSLPNLKATPTGSFQTTIATVFDRDSLSTGLDIVKSVIGSQLTEFQSLKMTMLALELSIPSIQMKALIRDFNDKALHRLSQIENYAKNKLRHVTLGLSSTQKLGKVVGRLAEIDIPDLFPETSTPIFVPKLVKPSNLLMPNPLLEAFRYVSGRELGIYSKDIEYGKYGEECECVKVIRNAPPITPDEIHIARPLAKCGLGVDILAISPDGETIVSEYPLEYVPLSYILAKNPFKTGNARNISIARLWLSKILVILAGLHEEDVVVRSVLPSNFLVSYDGSKLLLQSLADGYFGGATVPKLPFESAHSPWLPPEHFAGKKPTTAYDIYQFGVLMLLTLTDYLAPSFGEVIAKHMKYSQEDGMILATSRKFFFDPFDGFNKSEFKFMAAKGEELRVLIDVQCPVSPMDIIAKCLDVDPQRRPSAFDLLRSPFFAMTQQAKSRAENLTFSIVRKPPVSILVDAVFRALCQRIEDEIVIDPLNLPTLETAVDILNYFINKDDSGVNIALPLEEGCSEEITNEIFNQNMFDRIVRYVINRLHKRFEFELDVESDRPFTKLVKLYDRFMRASVWSPIVARKIVSSFPYLVTGVDRCNDSHRLFCFLHKNVRPMVELFFEAARENVFSKFYCEHYLQFYDNSRDFAEAFAERSERRHAASINFFSSFVDRYPNESTMRLLLDFQIAHKIEQSMCFSFKSGRLAAIRLLSKIIHLECYDTSFLNGFVFTNFANLLVSEQQPYEEKLEMLDLIHYLFFAKSMIPIVALLTTGILDAILFCTLTRIERSESMVWGEKAAVPIWERAKQLLSDLCRSGPSNVIATIFCDRELFLKLVQLKAIAEPESKTFYALIEKMKIKKVVEASLVTTMAVVENAPLATITAITGLSQQAFEAALCDISDLLVAVGPERYKLFNLYHSLLEIWENQGWSLEGSLFDAIGEGITKRYEGHIEMAILAVQVIQRQATPACFAQYPILWFRHCVDEHIRIRKAMQSKSHDAVFLENYRGQRLQRIQLWSALLSHPNRGLLTQFEMTYDFPSYLVNTLLKDTTKIDISVRVIPASFSRFNHTYLLKSEGMSFLAQIFENRSKCPSLFGRIVRCLHDSCYLEFEANEVRAGKDREYRKTLMRLLDLMTTEDDVFKMNEKIAQSQVLRLLKDEALNDWEEFQMVRKSWDMVFVTNHYEAYAKARELYRS